MGDQIKRRRWLLGLSREKVAAAANVSIGTVAAIEKGASVNLDSLHAVLAALGLRLDLAPNEETAA